ncbi:MAG: hypothetical protein FWG41_00370 [Methanomassiliicoccaceae archaeon]|nr:hypothetical protein [Methanomassiliicoccaceae archaeon]
MLTAFEPYFLLYFVSCAESLNYSNGFAVVMWKILGMKTIYIDIPNTAKRRLIELAGDSEKGEMFKGLMGKSEVMFLLNGDTEENSFFITVPDDLTPEGIQLMADVVLDIAKTIEFPFVEVEGAEQRYQVIITNNKEPELLGINKTPGMSSAEVFKPIIRSLDSRGKMNPGFRNQF